MMSGLLYWGSGNLVVRGTSGYFWASTPYAYTYSRYLGFYSTNVTPKDGDNKPSGFTLRRVAQSSSKMRVKSSESSANNVSRR
ncbi:hypothetical protein IKF63_02785 [Candidatus Saccharibacteria bacterium]|nr:hypothetical protein [Candidatus Saccharibacteria bacterium]